jgi:4-hydroxy-tetrahydrodipicolinate reductase
MLNIALIGYGQMGKMLEKLAPEHDCQIIEIFDPGQDEYKKEITAETLRNVDVCIDFSLPEAVLKNIETIAPLNKNIVIGTTGWQNDLQKIKELVSHHNIGLIFAGNFSIGMNLFFLFTQYCSNLISQTGVYDVFGYELHHNRKADSPSGTARDLADIILSNFSDKETVQYDRVNRKIGQKELHFASIRGGSIPGTHVIGFDSPFDSIELKHTARTREGFAVGALKASHWINKRKGFFEFRKIFTDLLGPEENT